jgi:hypothetical protein
MDAIVAGDSALQEVVQGKRLLLWGPGYAATASAHACMSFGSICSLVSFLFLGSLDITHFEHMLVFGFLPSGAVLIGLSQTVLRGWTSGRQYIYRFTQILTILSASVFIACLAQGGGQRQWTFAFALSSLGFLFSVVAMRLVAGTGYALTSATFRARRAYAKRVSEERPRVSQRSRR